MADFLELMSDESWRGYGSIRNPHKSDVWKKQLSEVNRLLENRQGRSTRAWAAKLEEAMSTDTFTYLFADILDRKLEAAFQGVGTPLAPVFRKATLRDFRARKIQKITGQTQRLQKVNELGEYTAQEVADSEVEYSLEKYGRIMQWSWESFINDDIGLIDSFPQTLANNAINTLAYLQTSLLFDADGPIDANMTGDGGLAAIATTALSIANLQAAITAMQGYTDNDEPILNKPKYLVVGPILEMTARTILSDAALQVTTTANVPVSTFNALSQYRLELIVDPWLPLLATNNVSSWALVAAPEFCVGCEFGELAGHVGPELFVKAPTQSPVGGGGGSPMDGGFETDAAAYKVRLVAGGTGSIEHRAFWGSQCT